MWGRDAKKSQQGVRFAMHHTRTGNIQSPYHVLEPSGSRVWCVTTGAEVSQMRNKVVTCIWKWSSGAGLLHGAFLVFILFYFVHLPGVGNHSTRAHGMYSAL